MAKNHKAKEMTEPMPEQSLIYESSFDEENNPLASIVNPILRSASILIDTAWEIASLGEGIRNAEFGVDIDSDDEPEKTYNLLRNAIWSKTL